MTLSSLADLPQLTDTDHLVHKQPPAAAKIDLRLISAELRPKPSRRPGKSGSNLPMIGERGRLFYGTKATRESTKKDWVDDANPRAKSQSRAFANATKEALRKQKEAVEVFKAQMRLRRLQHEQ